MGTSIASGKTFQRIFDATARIDAAKNVAQVLGELRRGLDAYGFKSCLIANVPRPETGSFEQHIMINSWPSGWHSRYREAGFYRFDPCAALSRQAAQPFLWSDVSSCVQTAESRRVMDEAREFGLREGVCVPIEIETGDAPGVVTVAGSKVDLGSASRCCVHALSRHAYFAAARIRGASKSSLRRGLSKREREILQWSAEGKTAWEISTILGVAESTVNTHLRSVRQKLDAANIVHAIVEAIRRHEIFI